MAAAAVYIVHRALYRIGTFFEHWFMGSLRVITHKTLSILESLDQTLALKITLNHFFDPLYQDHSFIGHTLGILFRSMRAIVATMVYGVIIGIAVAVYAAWIGICIYAMYRIVVFFPQ